MKLLLIGLATSIALSVSVGASVTLFHLRGPATSLQEPADPSSVDRTASVEALLEDKRESIEPIHPIPLHIELDQRRVALGSALFADPRLSANGTVACSSCHSLAHGGADGKARSVGIYGRVGSVNTLSVFNSGFNFKQFWDGRADTLEDQIAGPLLNRDEMGSNWPQVLGKLREEPKTMRAFAEIYPDGLTRPNLENAIATFERSLYTPNSRFDKYLRGDSEAISAEEKRGYQIFKSYGCATCHQGVNVGGNMFQRHGVFHPLGSPEPEILRVPSLRNVAEADPDLGKTSGLLQEAMIITGEAVDMKAIDRILTIAGPDAMKCSGCKRIFVLSKYTRLPVRTFTAPTETRMSPSLMRSKSANFSSVSFSCAVS